MPTQVTIRKLQRQTSAVFHELESSAEPIVVTRDGIEIARITAMTRAERQWRQWIRELGGDPDDPAWRRAPDARPRPAEPGGKLSEHLESLRDGER